MGAPNLNEITELPVNLSVEYDRLDQIKNSIRFLDLGYMRDPALLVDQMLKDDRVSGDLSTLVNGILSSPIHIEAANEKRKARLIADALDTDFRHMFPPDQLGELIKWGLMTGIGVGELVWDAASDGALRPGEWRPRIKVWHSQFVYWQWSTYRYNLITAHEGTIELPRTDRDMQSDGKWIVFTPFGYAHGYRRALLRQLAVPWMMRQWAYRDWARYSEVHGLPIRKAFTPTQAELRKRERFIQSVANIGSETAIECPTNADGQKFDLQLEEAQGNSVDAFDKLIDRCEKSISIAILGQDSSNRAQGGSLAQAKENIRLDHLVAYSERIAETIESQAVTWWVRHNVGDTTLTPDVSFDVLPADDEEKEANALNAVATALSTFALAGSPVDDRAILDAHGIPLLPERERVAAPSPAPEAPLGAPVGGAPSGGGKFELAPSTIGSIVTVNEARASIGQGPLLGLDGQPDPDGKLPISTYEAKKKDVIRESPTSDTKAPPAGETAVAAKNESDDNVSARYLFQGLPIAVENATGTTREWLGGSTRMLFDYGFIEGHTGSDGEELDVYVGPDANARTVHIVHQLVAPEYKKHDEDKIFLGFTSADDARAAYVRHRNDGDKAIGGMTSIPLDRFKAKLRARSGSGKIHASAVSDVGSSVELSDRPAYAEKRATRYAGGGTYPAKLTTKATAIGARVIRPDLDAIMADIRAAKSYDDLRKRLEKRYEKMDPARLARVVKASLMLAQLSGRHDILKESIP